MRIRTFIIPALAVFIPVYALKITNRSGNPINTPSAFAQFTDKIKSTMRPKHAEGALDNGATEGFTTYKAHGIMEKNPTIKGIELFITTSNQVSDLSNTQIPFDILQSDNFEIVIDKKGSGYSAQAFYNGAPYNQMVTPPGGPAVAQEVRASAAKWTTLHDQLAQLIKAFDPGAVYNQLIGQDIDLAARSVEGKRLSEIAEEASTKDPLAKRKGQQDHWNDLMIALTADQA